MSTRRPGYFVASTGKASEEMIAQYIENQQDLERSQDADFKVEPLSRMAGLLRILQNPQHTQGLGRMDPKAPALHGMETVDARDGPLQGTKSLSKKP